MESPHIRYFEVSPIADPTALETLKDKVAAEMRERIENGSRPRNIRFTFRNLSEPPPGPVVVNRWEARAEFYSARMPNPQFGYFEVSTLDSPATLRVMKDKVAAKMRARIEKETGQVSIIFTFRNLSEPDSRPGGNTRWEARADF